MNVVLHTPPLSTHPTVAHIIRSTACNICGLMTLGEKDVRALHTYKILKVRQSVCTFTEADTFVIFQYGIGHSTRHRNFPATFDVVIGNNTLCEKHIGEISHLIVNIDITLTVFCFQVKTLRFSLYGVQGCILLFKLLVLLYFAKVKFTVSSSAHARACANVNPASFMLLAHHYWYANQV